MEQNMGNTNTDQQNNGTSPSGGSQSQEEKLFTQEEVNRIIQNRISRVKSENSLDIQERERELSHRETLMDARERIADAGLPKDLINAIDCSSKEKMENSIRIIQSLFEVQKKPTTGTYRVSTGTSSNSNGSGHNKSFDIREAMGLKG